MTTQTPDAVREAVHIIQNMQKRLLWQIAFVFAAHRSRYVIGFWESWLLARDAWDESDSGDCDPADAFREISYEWEF